jgi:hypothetical protein
MASELFTLHRHLAFAKTPDKQARLQCQMPATDHQIVH